MRQPKGRITNTITPAIVPPMTAPVLEVVSEIATFNDQNTKYNFIEFML